MRYAAACLVLSNSLQTAALPSCVQVPETQSASRLHTARTAVKGEDLRNCFGLVTSWFFSVRGSVLDSHTAVDHLSSCTDIQSGWWAQIEIPLQATTWAADGRGNMRKGTCRTVRPRTADPYRPHSCRRSRHPSPQDARSACRHHTCAVDRMCINSSAGENTLLLRRTCSGCVKAVMRAKLAAS